MTSCMFRLLMVTGVLANPTLDEQEGVSPPQANNLCSKQIDCSDEESDANNEADDTKKTIKRDVTSYTPSSSVGNSDNEAHAYRRSDTGTHFTHLATAPGQTTTKYDDSRWPADQHNRRQINQPHRGIHTSYFDQHSHVSADEMPSLPSSHAVYGTHVHIHTKDPRNIDRASAPMRRYVQPAQQQHDITRLSKKADPTPKEQDEDLLAFIQAIVRTETGGDHAVKLFDAAVLYDKQDYDEAVHLKAEIEELIRDELQEDLRIELFDSGEFNESQVLVVEDVVNRCSVILVYLTQHSTSAKFNFFCEEAVGLSRLGANSKGVLENQFVLKPVHTLPKARRSYRTPVGLLTMNGIEWYDRHSNYTRNRLISMMKTAMQTRRSREGSTGPMLLGHNKVGHMEYSENAVRHYRKPGSAEMKYIADEVYKPTPQQPDADILQRLGSARIMRSEEKHMLSGSDKHRLIESAYTHAPGTVPAELSAQNVDCASSGSAQFWSEPSHGTADNYSTRLSDQYSTRHGTMSQTPPYPSQSSDKLGIGIHRQPELHLANMLYCGPPASRDGRGPAQASSFPITNIQHQTGNDYVPTGELDHSIVFPPRIRSMEPRDRQSLDRHNTSKPLERQNVPIAFTPTFDSTEHQFENMFRDRSPIHPYPPSPGFYGSFTEPSSSATDDRPYPTARSAYPNKSNITRTLHPSERTNHMSLSREAWDRNMQSPTAMSINSSEGANESLRASDAYAHRKDNRYSVTNQRSMAAKRRPHTASLTGHDDTPINSELSVVSKVTGKLIVNPNLSTDDVEIDTQFSGAFPGEAADPVGQLPQDTSQRQVSRDRAINLPKANLPRDEEASRGDEKHHNVKPTGRPRKNGNHVVNIVGSNILQIGNANTVMGHLSHSAPCGNNRDTEAPDGHIGHSGQSNLYDEKKKNSNNKVNSIGMSDKVRQSSLATTSGIARTGHPHHSTPSVHITGDLDKGKPVSQERSTTNELNRTSVDKQVDDKDVHTLLQTAPGRHHENQRVVTSQRGFNGTSVDKQVDDKDVHTLPQSEPGRYHENLCVVTNERGFNGCQYAANDFEKEMVSATLTDTSTNVGQGQLKLNIPPSSPISTPSSNSQTSPDTNLVDHVRLNNDADISDSELFCMEDEAVEDLVSNVGDRDDHLTFIGTRTNSADTDKNKKKGNFVRVDPDSSIDADDSVDFDYSVDVDAADVDASVDTYGSVDDDYSVDVDDVDDTYDSEVEVRKYSYFDKDIGKVKKERPDGISRLGDGERRKHDADAESSSLFADTAVTTDNVPALADIYATKNVLLAGNASSLSWVTGSLSSLTSNFTNLLSSFSSRESPSLLPGETEID